jgi:DNA-binding transcriptional regulator YhcF (GntR family)
MRTFNYLQDKGIIYNKRGMGYYVADDGYERTQVLKREQFISEDLPALFRAMHLLGLSFEDLRRYYSQFNGQSNGQS